MEDYLQLFKNETNLYSSILLGGLVPRNLWEPLPHFLRTWLRMYIGGTLIYLVSGFLWSFYIYYLKPKVYISQDAMPSVKTMISHISISMKSMPWYAVLPTLSEYMVENGWTKCFSAIAEVGWFADFVYVITYLVTVEFLIYWVHRGLHDIKPIYKYMHSPHHLLNKKKTLSPFADGILQAMPHFVALFMVPTHFTTHLFLMLMEALWTANIHDCIDGKLWPVMGAGYHTIHHTSYRYNYGHYTILMDWMFGTLCGPKSGTTRKEI